MVNSEILVNLGFMFSCSVFLDCTMAKNEAV